jgi:hypothetical protein
VALRAIRPNPLAVAAALSAANCACAGVLSGFFRQFGERQTGFEFAAKIAALPGIPALRCVGLLAVAGRKSLGVAIA